jgi:hypothetical protein
MGLSLRRVVAVSALAGVVLLGADAASAQTPPPVTPPPQAAVQAPAGQRLRVFLECDCFETYLREELDFVDYVRQAQDADVHVLSRTTGTGGGGREVVLRFSGRGRFEGADQEFRVVTLAGDTEDTQRRAIARTMTVGLLYYMARAGLPAHIDVSVEAREAAEAAAGVRDRWNLWVFEIEASGSIDAQESNRDRELNVRVSADRVSAAWKISFGAQAEQQRERFTIVDDEDPEESGTFETRRRENNVEGLIVKSYGPHWSFGGGAEVNSSTFGNTRLAARVAAAVEFSIFPYQDYATRQWVLNYQASVERAKYNEITLFDKLDETLFRQEMSIRFDQRQPWGSLEARAEFSQYFHDFSKYRLEVSGEVDLRITRGLSLSFDGSASRIRDQLSLPRRNASPSEVLLRLRELQSGYEVDFSFGVTYSFGSLFNNVVNPRFGG